MKNNVYICISGPSAAGKTTLIEQAVEILKGKGFSVAATLSSTNRLPREYERDGVDYRFFTPEEFQRLKDNGDFFVNSKCHGNEYGTLNRDRDCRKEEILLLNIDYAGAMEIKERFPDATVTVFITADLAVLQQRLARRASEEPEKKAQRIADMKEQLASAINYDYIIFNNDLQAAVNELCTIIKAQANRLALSRNMMALHTVLAGQQ